MKRYSYIDSLKGIAILMVLLVHCGFSNLTGLFGKIGNSGRYGVQLFFLISAFLSFNSYKKFLDNSKNVTASSWIKSKYLKLLPIYLIMIIVETFIISKGNVYWLGNEKSISPLNFISHILLLHGFFPHFCNSILGIEWYLGVLFIWYLCIPFLYKIITSFTKSCLAFLISIVFSNIFLITLLNYTNGYYIYENFISYYSIVPQLPVLFLGITFFYLSEKIKEYKNNKLLSYILFSIVVLLVYGEITGINNIFAFSAATRYGIYYLILLIAIEIYSIKLIDNKIFSFFGKYSYEIYLTHFTIIKIYEKNRLFSSSNLLLQLLIEYLIVIIISILLSVITRKMIKYIKNKEVELL